MTSGSPIITPKKGNKASSKSQGKPRINILSIDGGGIRGVIPSTFLEAIEEYFSRDGRNKRIHEIFHTIGGTSTGGIISVMMSVPGRPINPGDPEQIMQASQATQFYQIQGKMIFPKTYLSFFPCLVVLIFLWKLAKYLESNVTTQLNSPTIDFINLIMRFVRESSDITIALISTILPFLVCICYLMRKKILRLWETLSFSETLYSVRKLVK